MIKECEIIRRTDIACVVLFDKVEVQIPLLDESIKTATIKCENGVYEYLKKETTKTAKAEKK